MSVLEVKVGAPVAVALGSRLAFCHTPVRAARSRSRWQRRGKRPVHGHRAIFGALPRCLRRRVGLVDHGGAFVLNSDVDEGKASSG